ncbi:unnamed protein product, partial [Prorocentrum cordatum]
MAVREGARRLYASKRRVQEGLITISANDVLELPVEVPTNATLHWDFDVEGGEMEFTVLQSVPGEEDHAAELEDEDGAAPIVADKWEPIENWQALRVPGRGERTSGVLREAGWGSRRPPAQSVDGRQLLLLRWDNTGAWLWSRTVRYRVQVVPPAAPAAPEGPEPARRPPWLRAASAAAVLVAAAAVALPPL